MKKILIINGPNLNMLGVREPGIYGSETLDTLYEKIRKRAEKLVCEVEFFQSNIEGEIINSIHSAMGKFDGIVINPGAFTHYSYAIRDAIEAVADFTPFVEVHMSDIHKREDFRKISVITDVCVKQICGFGKDSYKMGIDLLLEIL